MVVSRGHRAFGIPAGDDEHVLVMMPIAPEHFTFEVPRGAGRHRQHNTRLRNRLDLDALAESDVAVVDRFERIRTLAPDAKRGNPEADLDSLGHVLRLNCCGCGGSQPLIPTALYVVAA